jgi:GNAT superfamily N-acetyltransferase
MIKTLVDSCIKEFFLKNDMLIFVENLDNLDSKISAFVSSIKSKYPQLLQFLIYPKITLDDTKSIYLSDLYLKPEFQGKGIGTKIMKEIIDFADKNQLPITLVPAPESIKDIKRLNRFYQKFGFSKRPDIFPDGVYRPSR